MRSLILTGFERNWIELFDHSLEHMALKKFLFDTDVIIDFLRGDEQAVQFFEGFEHEFNTSVITIAELYSGVKGEEEWRDLEYFISLFTVIPLTTAIAKEAGGMRQTFFNSHGMGLADALIAATAKACEFNLISLNKRHFSMLESLTIPYSK